MDAQIALLNPTGWAVIGCLRRASGLSPHPLPGVTCPVLDIRPLAPNRVETILRRHISGPAGVRDVDDLVADLLEAGAECACCLPEQSCPACRSASRRVYAAEVCCAPA